MAGNGFFYFEIDRDSAQFNFSFDYMIDAYYDPESGEEFYKTHWSVVYSKDGGYVVPYSDYVDADSASGWLQFGLDGASGHVNSYSLNFSAENSFSAVDISSQWRVYSVAYETSDQLVTGSTGTDVIIGGYGDDYLKGMAGNDIFDAGEGDDIVDGGDGNDRLDGGLGNDTLIGGKGDDVYIVDSTDDSVVEKSNGGTDTIYSSANYTLSANVERLYLTGIGTISGTGTTGKDFIVGNDAANSLYGLDGDDNLQGGGGADKLYGGEGKDRLDGGAGIDRLEGGNGDDTYVIDTRSDKIIEAVNAGIDEVQTGADITGYTLGANLDILTTLGLGNFHGVGNELRNNINGGYGNDWLEGKGDSDTLNGGHGNDTLNGGAGADELRGGDGIDTATYVDSALGVQVNLSTSHGYGGDAQGDLLLGIENLIGSSHDDILTGNILDNKLTGGLGSDTLSGGFGNDVLIGGAGGDSIDGGDGIDTVSYSGSVDGVMVSLLTHDASGGDAQGDNISRVENITGGNGNDTLTGDAGANSLSGGLGVDTIKGGEGNDWISGGAGGDWLDGEGGVNTLSYSGSVGGVTVDLYTMVVSGGDAEGDHVYNFSNAYGGNGDDFITGTDGANRLMGRDGADTLDGQGGNDWINGGAGADHLFGGLGTDTISYSGSTNINGVVVNLQAQIAYNGDATGDVISGFENAEGSEQGDLLYGSTGANTLIGRAGYDYLDGGAGNDKLTGGTEQDTFVFGAGYGRDTVTDFVTGGAGDMVKVTFGSTFDTFAEVMAVAHTVGTGVVFNFDAQDSLTLQNVQIGLLTADNFTFL